MKIVKRLGKLPDSVAVLNYGTGPGQWALLAKSFGCDVFAYDLSNTWIYKAASNGTRVMRDLEHLRGMDFDVRQHRPSSRTRSDIDGVINLLFAAVKLGGFRRSTFDFIAKRDGASVEPMPLRYEYMYSAIWDSPRM